MPVFSRVLSVPRKDSLEQVLFPPRLAKSTSVLAVGGKITSKFTITFPQTFSALHCSNRSYHYYTMGVALNISPLSKTLSEQDRRRSDRLFDAARPIGDDFEFDDDENDVSESVSSSSMSTPRGPHRCITFSYTVEYFDIISLDDYVEKEIRRCWYSSEEKDRMNRNKDKTVARLEAGKPARSGMTYQGLQCWTAAGGQALDESIALVVNAVMDEQDRQWAANQDDFDRIARISASATAHSAKAALETGLKDEMEARLAWSADSDFDLFSEHSNDTEEIPIAPNARSELFSAPKLVRKRSKVQDLLAFGEGDDSVGTFKNDFLKNNEKSFKRPSQDPPARVERTTSQDGSEVLYRMRAVTMK